MLGLEIDFVAGRYHATPWRHQVNEGVVEWPPSPWRLLRALLAGWFRLGEPETEVTARSLIARLAASEPVYVVPPWTEGHTRHYMPTDGQPTLVFDAFVVLDRDHSKLQVGFPSVDLTADERALLERMVQQVRYVGRAESWADVSLREIDPGQGAIAPGRGEKVLSLRSPMSQAAYADWRKQAASRIKKPGNKPPADLWGALTASTADLHKARWSEAPGSRQVAYDVSRMRPVRPARRPRSRERSGVRVARFALKPRDGLLPLFTQAVGVADALHKALANRGDGQPMPLLLGKDREGRMLRNVGHAYVFATDEVDVGRDDRRITHLHVALPAEGPEGFTGAGVNVLRGLRSFYVDKGRGPSRGDGSDRDESQRRQVDGRQVFDLVLEGLWTGQDLESLGSTPPALQSARVWRSKTPVVLLRYPKVRADGTYKKDSPRQQVERYLKQLGLPEPVHVEPFGETAHWHGFQRWRMHGRQKLPLGHRGFGFEVEFAEPVRGPIAIGYAAHLGLGRFEPKR